MKRKKNQTKPAPAPAKKMPSIRPLKKELDGIKKQLVKERRPLYQINKKIKEAPTKYYERKYKKQRDALLNDLQPKINDLITSRKEAKEKINSFTAAQSERNDLKKKVKSIEKRILTAEENNDWAEVERLRYEELKYLGLIDKASEKMGAKLTKSDTSGFDPEDYDDDDGYFIDELSPYAIWEAIKQFHNDLNSGKWKFMIINGKRYSTKNPIELSAQASLFWITTKGKIGGTPYVNRFINEKKLTVKYLFYNS